MHELFSAPGQTLELTLFYKMEKTASGQSIPFVISEEEYNKAKVDDEMKDKVRSIKTEWVQPSWKTGNDILQSSTQWNYHAQDDTVNWNSYRDKRLKMLLVGWDVKDKDGNLIPCNEDTINMLHQNIALALLKKYDKATKVEKEEETKN